MTIKINKCYLIFFLSKIAYMFFALFVFSKFTHLGDTARYLSGRTYGDSRWFYSSTYMMDFFAHSFNLILGPVLANLPFVFLSFYGVYFSVKRLELHQRDLFFLLVILSMPSFGVWTSIASKEAVGVFFMGGILGAFIDYIKDRPVSVVFLILSIYLCFVFKPQYLIGVFCLFLFVFISKKMNLKGWGKVFLIVVFFSGSFFSLFVFRSQINDLSFIMPKHFSLDAGSTRVNDIWLNDYDVFWNAPYGMFIAFFGPTFDEALSKPSHLLAFIESLVILLVISYYFFKIVFYIKLRNFNVYYIGIVLIPMIWILFVHYPFGVLNPGSALRYRENFFAFFIVIVFFCYKEVKLNYLIRRKNIDE